MTFKTDKQLLHELLQINHTSTTPEYSTTRVPGTPDHAPLFECELSLPAFLTIDHQRTLLAGHCFTAQGRNKQKAEQAAARAAVEYVLEHAPATVTVPAELLELRQPEEPAPAAAHGMRTSSAAVVRPGAAGMALAALPAANGRLASSAADDAVDRMDITQLRKAHKQALQTIRDLEEALSAYAV